MTGFAVPDHVRPIRDRVLAFVRERVEPAEGAVLGGGDDGRDVLRGLQADAKAAGLWALGHPVELGGGGLPFLDYVYVNEVQGRSEIGQLALGTLNVGLLAPIPLQLGHLLLADLLWVATIALGAERLATARERTAASKSLAAQAAR